jgi:hypothetical protein
MVRFSTILIGLGLVLAVVPLPIPFPGAGVIAGILLILIGLVIRLFGG